MVGGGEGEGVESLDVFFASVITLVIIFLGGRGGPYQFS